MVTDATVPSLVLLAVLVLAVLGARLVDAALQRRRHRAGRPARAARADASLRLPRVVLLDDDQWSPAAA